MSLPLSLKINTLSSFFIFLTLLVLPFQSGKHFWPSYAFVLGQRIDYLSPTFYISDVFIFVLFLLLAKRFFLTIGKMFWFALLFLSFGIFFSQSPQAGWYGLVKFIEVVFFGWVIFSHKEYMFSFLFWTFSIDVLLEGMLGVLQIFHQGSLNGFWYFLGERSFSASTPGIANASIHGQLFLRPYATFPHPNVFAGYLVITLLFFLATALFSKETILRVSSYASLAIGTIILVLTLSRVALVVWFVLALGAVFLKIEKKLWIGLFLLLGLFIIFVNPVLFGRFFDTASYTESLEFRQLLQQASFGMIASSPFIGVGLNNFLVILPNFLHDSMLFDFFQPVHNIYLLVFSETGVIGIIFFLVFLGNAFFNNFFTWKKSPSIISFFGLLAFCAVVVIGLTDHYFLTLQQGQLLFALILGLSIGHGTIPIWRFIKNLPHIPFIKS